MHRKTVLRVDGSSTIGLGHLVRCLALAHILKSDFEIQFVCIDIPDSIIQDLEANDFSFLKIEKEDDFFEILNGNEIVVLDSYEFDSDYQKHIKEIGSKLVCIDDLHDKQYVADLIINHSPGQSSDIYDLKGHTELALGIKYALLRPSFYLAAKTTRNIKQVSTVFICLGGADPRNITKSVLQVVSTMDGFKEIVVVIGSSYLYKASLEDISNHDFRIKIQQALSEKDMVAAMSSAELAIVSVSGTLFEVLATGAIPLICYYAENQKELFHYFKNNRGFKTFNALDFDENELKVTIKQIIKSTKSFEGLEEKNDIKGAPNRIRNLFKKL
jgi:UDP-2,4-diacetamido-2,4,6-trideoxy-beta-L-altropyranose hydrolase